MVIFINWKSKVSFDYQSAFSSLMFQVLGIRCNDLVETRETDFKPVLSWKQHTYDKPLMKTIICMPIQKKQ